MNMTRNQNGEPVEAFVDFGCNLGLGMNQEITAMHIHRGERGQNGPVVIDSQFGPAIMAGPGPQRLFRQVEVVDMPRLGILQEIMDNPGGFYVNIHSTENPAGFCRDQLRVHDADRPASMDRRMDRIQQTTDTINERQGRLMRANSLRP